MRAIRTIEQGLGRSVRGEKDYSVIIIIGADVTRLVRDKRSRAHLSKQMSTQIEIGLEIAEMARQEIGEGTEPLRALADLIRQCLKRDPSWKAFYAQQMEAVRPAGVNDRTLRIYSAELKAEQLFRSGDYSGAIAAVQSFLDAKLVEEHDKGWYLQEMARYNYQAARLESEKLQSAAYSRNRFLLRPPSGVIVTKLTIVSEGRIKRLIEWVRQHETYEQLNVALSDILGKLSFGVEADRFEYALDALSDALGFAGERPDKEWKEGPDNLWALNDTQYILWECKSEVDLQRAEINKREAEQMNRSCAWFEKHYRGSKVKNVIVIPTHQVARSAAFTHKVEAMREGELSGLKQSVRDFFSSFESMDFKDLSTKSIQKLLNSHELSVGALFSGRTKKLRSP